MKNTYTILGVVVLLTTIFSCNKEDINASNFKSTDLLGKWLIVETSHDVKYIVGSDSFTDTEIKNGEISFEFFENGTYKTNGQIDVLENRIDKLASPIENTYTISDNKVIMRVYDGDYKKNYNVYFVASKPQTEKLEIKIDIDDMKKIVADFGAISNQSSYYSTLLLAIRSYEFKVKLEKNN
ncbi:MAG: hypothetical protein ACRCVT_06725 [Leadbetterella sp.]